VNKLKKVIIFETIIIIILVIAIIFFNIDIFKPFIIQQNKDVYCEKHYYDNKVCLLSPRIYTNIIPQKNYLILNFESLKTDIQNYIDDNHFNLSVYIINARDGASFGIDEDKLYQAISLNKLPIAVIILKKVEEGKLSLDTKLPIEDKDRDNSFGTLYAQPVNELSVRDLLRYMLSESDNTALWVLSKKITKEDLLYFTKYIDYYSNDINSEKFPIDTKTSPKTVSNIFLSLYLSTILNADDSELILSYLTNSSFDIKKYAQLPDDVVVSQKYGFYYLNNLSFFHSCGIIYVEDSRFSYCIMSKDIEREKAPEVIGTIVNKLYNFVVEGRKVKNIGI